MAARKPKTAAAYKVIGPAAVIRKDKNERYLDRGAIVLSEDLDDANAEHLLGLGLIEEFELPAAESESGAAGGENPPAS